MRGQGSALVSANVNHGVRLLFCTRDSISVFIHPPCEVGTWFGSSMGVTSAPLNWEPSKVPADKCRVNELAEADASYVAQEFVPLGMGC